VTTPTYRASETLLVPFAHIETTGTRTSGVNLECRDAKRPRGAHDERRHCTSRGRGRRLAQFSVVGSPEASPLIKVVTTSVQRQDANRTLTIVDSVIKQKLFTMQTAAGAQAQDLFTSSWSLAKTRNG